ncbi:MAG: UDP-N-acetylmuramoyl-tripeptide--D-alanyl-D-alanine ligase [Oscillospiraceae bacterium]|nr:UDP-N-acetylmuramoyl-tripeptide--D-alanyl-D-alanine ligase [Oscillospiraceae bacterium]
METIIFFTLLILTILASLFYFRRSMHMFQLNSYKADTHFKWFRQNWHKLYFHFKKTKAKKPLVYTHRVLRMCVTVTIIYTALQVLIIYSGMYFLLPLLAVFIPFFPIIANFINIPVERANNARYIKEAVHIINSLPNLTTIGITGSYGKTSTKYYLNKLLSVKYNVLMTPESYNTTLGVVKTIRGSLNATHDIFICEMGMKWKGDIRELCDLVRPRHSMLTSIGHQHMETMGSLNNIIKEKFEIVDCIIGGTVFLNYDNEHIRERQTEKLKEKTTVTYGITSQDADYKANDISVSEKGTEFTITAKGETVTFTTKLLGNHTVQNITGAIAIAHTMGIELKELVLPVKRLEPVPHRLQIINKGNDIIIDDAFNSNPSGAKSALEVLKTFDGVKILITPGMIELGDQSYSLNKEFGINAAASCDYVLLIGEKQAIPIKDGLREAKFPEDKIITFASFNEGMAHTDYIETNGKKKIILIENDLPDNY